MISALRPVESRHVAQHYDELDRYYRELWGEDLHHGLWIRGDEEPREAIENLTRLVAERGGVGPGDRVCDVGCGYGGTARFLARAYGARVVGLTLSEVQHRHAVGRSVATEDVRILLGDWMENDLPAGGFDVVVAVESASHMSDKVRFLDECRRVVRSGGRVVVAAWLAAEEASPWQVRHLLGPICEEGRLPGLGTRSDYLRWMDEVGLHLVAFDDLSRGVSSTWTWCLRRLCECLLTDPEARRDLLDARRSERRFPLTVLRMSMAYRVGALRYGVFTTTTA